MTHTSFELRRAAHRAARIASHRLHVLADRLDPAAHPHPDTPPPRHHRPGRPGAAGAGPATAGPSTSTTASTATPAGSTREGAPTRFTPPARRRARAAPDFDALIRLLCDAVDFAESLRLDLCADGVADGLEAVMCLAYLVGGMGLGPDGGPPSTPR